MRSGELDKAITIQSVSRTVDATGYDAPTWSNVVANVPASILAYRGSEAFTADQTIGEDRATFKIRYREDLTTLNRIVYDGRNWDIVGVRPVGRREALEVDAIARSETASAP